MSRDDYTGEPFRSRAVAPDVAEERGYRQFGGPHGLGPLGQADPRFKHPDEGGATFIAPWDGRGHSYYNWSRYKVRGKTGWVMRKHALPGSAFDAPLAQLRPDVAIPLPEDDPEPHDHSDMGRVERLLHEEGSAHVYPSGRLVRVDDNGYPLSENDAKRGLGRELPLEGLHLHREASKYVIPPGRGIGKRWDTHPRCTGDRFLAAERVFLHLEGCLKLDALVSAGEVGADVPSVTLWDRHEITRVDFPGVDELDPRLDDGGVGQIQTADLRDFLAAYVRAPVIICCDSDWGHNPNVALEAFSLRDFVLREAELPCVVAAPPEGRYLRTDRLGRKIHVKRGSDDFQRARGKPDNLRVVEPRPHQAPGRLRFERMYRQARERAGVGKRRTPANTIDREMELLDWYATHSTAEGYVRCPVRRISKRLGIHTDTVRRYTLQLARDGALEIDGHYHDPDKARADDDGNPLEPWTHSHTDMTPDALREHLRSKRWRDDHYALADPGAIHVHWREPTAKRPLPAVIRVRADLAPELWQPTVGRWLRSLR